jgi:RNA polymerase sigma-70 factor (ECF subfamily)
LSEILPSAAQDFRPIGNYSTVMMELTANPVDEPWNGAVIDWELEWSQHNRWLRTVVLARVKEHQAVDEVMQEIACALAKSSAAISDIKSVGPWLYRVAVSQSIRYRRSQARRRRGLARYATGSPHNGHVSHSADPLRILLTEERRQLVAQALLRLPGRDAELLLLKYTECWSYRQLSQYLRLSEAAVDGRLQRARMRLRIELERLDTGEDSL